MFRYRFRNWWRSPEGVLTRLDGLIVRGWLMEMRRDLRFAASVLVIAGFVVAVVLAVSDLAAKHPWVGLGMASAVGFAVFRIFYISPHSVKWRQLQAGIFQPWTGFGSTLKRWRSRRAMVLALGACLGIALVVTAAHPKLGLPSLGGTGIGAAISLATADIRLHGRFSFWSTRRLSRHRIGIGIPTATLVSLKYTV